MKRPGVGVEVEHTRGGAREGITRLRDHPREREAMGREELEAVLDEYNWARREQALLGVCGQFS